MADDDPDALQACWEALAALQSIIPKEIQVCAVPYICTSRACWLLQRLRLYCAGNSRSNYLVTPPATLSCVCLLIEPLRWSLHHQMSK